jgi:hypothetical protein
MPPASSTVRQSFCTFVLDCIERTQHTSTIGQVISGYHNARTDGVLTACSSSSSRKKVEDVVIQLCMHMSIHDEEEVEVLVAEKKLLRSVHSSQPTWAAFIKTLQRDPLVQKISVRRDDSGEPTNFKRSVLLAIEGGHCTLWTPGSEPKTKVEIDMGSSFFSRRLFRYVPDEKEGKGSAFSELVNQIILLVNSQTLDIRMDKGQCVLLTLCRAFSTMGMEFSNRHPVYVRSFTPEGGGFVAGMDMDIDEVGGNNNPNQEQPTAGKDFSWECVREFVTEHTGDDVQEKAWVGLKEATHEDMPSADEWSCSNPNRLDPEYLAVSRH